jgi:hypothetical protein
MAWTSATVDAVATPAILLVQPGTSGGFAVGEPLDVAEIDLRRFDIGGRGLVGQARRRPGEQADEQQDRDTDPASGPHHQFENPRLFT